MHLILGEKRIICCYILPLFINLEGGFIPGLPLAQSCLQVDFRHRVSSLVPYLMYLTAGSWSLIRALCYIRFLLCISPLSLSVSPPCKPVTSVLGFCLLCPYWTAHWRESLVFFQISNACSIKQHFTAFVRQLALLMKKFRCTAESLQ